MRSIIILCSIFGGSISTEPPRVFGLTDYCKNGKTAEMRTTTKTEGLEDIVKKYSDLYFSLGDHRVLPEILSDFKRKFCYIMNTSRSKRLDLTVLIQEMLAMKGPPQFSTPTPED